MKKTARVILTFLCNRNCPGCCNESLNPSDYHMIKNINELEKYNEVVLTGGEPFLLSAKLLVRLVKRLHTMNKKVFLYTSNLANFKDMMKVVRHIDGLTLTLHAECTDKDITGLAILSELLYTGRCMNLRLFIDKRVYDRYDLSNIDFGAWDVIRKLEWKEKCEPAFNEDLLYMPISTPVGRWR